MKVQIDFSLNHRFGVVEQIIFRLVLNGTTSTRKISDLLGVFSDTVIANAFRHLVNQQILCADVNSGNLFPSDAVLAVIETCLNNSYDINIPESLKDMMSNGRLLISESDVKEESIMLKKAILTYLLPNIKLDFLAKVLDFSIRERGDSYDR